RHPPRYWPALPVAPPASQPAALVPSQPPGSGFRDKVYGIRRQFADTSLEPEVPCRWRLAGRYVLAFAAAGATSLMGSMARKAHWFLTVAFLTVLAGCHDDQTRVVRRLPPPERPT